MKIYLDYIFLENLIVNLLISISMYKFNKEKLKKINIILGSIFISIYTTIIYALNDTFFSSLYIKLIAVIIYTYITFKPSTFIAILKHTIYYFLFSFLYVGIIISVSILFKINLTNTMIKILIYLISGIILNIFTKYLWKMWKTNIKNNDLSYKLNINGQEIFGFVDTGNNVKDITTGLNVLFVDMEYKEKLKNILDERRKREIYTNTVNANSHEDGYIIKDVEVYKENKRIGKIKRIVICFVNLNISNKKYSALIGYNTYIENLKGVKFC